MIDPNIYDDFDGIYSKFKWNIPKYINLSDILCERHNKEKMAMIYEDQNEVVTKYTFDYFSKNSNKMANFFIEMGLERGDRVAIMLPQSPESMITHLAIYKIGAIAVPLSKLFGPSAIEYRVNNCEAKIMVIHGSYIYKIKEIEEKLKSIKYQIIVDNDKEIKGYDYWEEINSRSQRFEKEKTLANDPAIILYTSGTTGSPKGALHAHRHIFGFIPGFQMMHEFIDRNDEVFWTPADWAWVGGLYDLVFSAWWFSRPVVAYNHEKFDPVKTFQLMEKHKITNVFIPPTAIRMMKKTPLDNINLKLRVIAAGGEPVTQDVLNWAESHNITINEFYGQTETTFVAGGCRSKLKIKPGSMGKPFPGHKIKIGDVKGNLVSQDEVGEILVHKSDPSMFLGYWNNNKSTKEKFIGEWYKTGDMAHFDEDGYIWFQGRDDDLIKSSGYRIGPTEIEGVIQLHPSIETVAVVGVTDPMRGQIVKAYIKLKDHNLKSDKLVTEIQNMVKQKLASYQYPREIEFVEEMPLTVTGKLKRSKLRK